MNYAKIYYNDIANGPGFRTSLFVSGCNNHCKGCFNTETWDFNYGSPYTQEVQEHIVKSIMSPQIDGLSILGGEPMDEKNVATIHNLVKEVRELCPDKNIWIYTGYTFEELIARKNIVTDSILSSIDVLVDGKFDIDLKDIGLKFRGSSNQRIIDMPKTLDLCKVKLLLE